MGKSASQSGNKKIIQGQLYSTCEGEINTVFPVTFVYSQHDLMSNIHAMSSFI